MATIIIEMPKLSDTMSEGKILAWKKSEGEAVKAGEVLAEIESDKANMEMEAVDSGFVRKLLVPAGKSAAVGSPIAVVTEDANEEFSAALEKARAGSGQGGHSSESKPPPKPPAESREQPRAASPAPEPSHALAASRRTNGSPAHAPAPPARGGGVLASPLAFRIASELGLDLTSLRGSGPEGRIVKRDVLEAAKRGAPKTAGAAPPSAGERAAPAQKGAPYRPPKLSAIPPQSHEDVPVTSMRRIIAVRLQESKTLAPHFYLTVDADMKGAIRARDALNQITGVNITFNDIVVKAVSVCLSRHPGINASWQGEFVRYYKSVDIGVAVALPDGLLTPVVRACHLKTLGMISEEVKDLVERAKAKRLTPDDYKGGTFTVSNLGMFGVKHFTAIINPPEACILAVSAIEEVPVVENGAIVPGHRMSLTLSSDHRVVDGALAAQFMRDLKQMIENPMSLAL